MGFMVFGRLLIEPRRHITSVAQERRRQRHGEIFLSGIFGFWELLEALPGGGNGI